MDGNHLESGPGCKEDVGIPPSRGDVMCTQRNEQYELERCSRETGRLLKQVLLSRNIAEPERLPKIYCLLLKSLNHCARVETHSIILSLEIMELIYT